MADDTVEAARRELDERLDRAFDGATPAQITTALDALIAAVRAEQRALLNRNAATALIAAQDAGYVLATPDESS